MPITIYPVTATTTFGVKQYFSLKMAIIVITKERPILYK